MSLFLHWLADDSDVRLVSDTLVDAVISSFSDS